MSQFVIGQALGRYRLDASLGRGGMAEVFRATDARLGRVVAIKVILAAYALEPEFIGRFLREARLVAGLEHPNIVPVYDFGEEAGAPYLVMPFLAGGTLADRMAASPGRALPTASVTVWVEGLASALDAAHRAGVLHRDVKPGNVLIGSDGRALLADFGIAKMHQSATRLTTTGMVVGTPLYMAPELAKGGEATPASDAYALAVLAFELVTGRPPFAGENALALLHQHVHTPPPRPTSHGRDLPAALDPLFERALAKTAGERFSACRDFAAALREAYGLRAASGAPPDAPLPVTGRTRALAALETRPTPRRRARWIGLAAGAALALTALVVWRSAEPAPPEGPVESGEAVDTEPAAPATPAAPDPDLPAARKSAPPPAAANAVAQAPSAAPAPPPAVTPAPPPPVTSAGAAAPSTPRPNAVPAAVPEAPATTPLAARGPGRLAGRDGPRRLVRADFERMLGGVTRRGPGLRAGAAEAAETYARGGLSYLDGDRAAARAAIEAILPAAQAVPAIEPALFAALRSFAAAGLEDWHVAIAYGDARREAADLLGVFEAGHPGDASAAMGRAVLAAIDGDPRGAAAIAAEAYRSNPKPRLAAFIAQQHAAAGSAREALGWFEIAAAAEGTEAGFAAMQGAKLARQLALPDKARELQERACALGIRAACGDRPALRRRP